nr:phosphotransferase family protein [Micromonospora sp. DSM 115978]
MSTDALPTGGNDGLDARRVTAWLADVVDPALSTATLDKLAGGHSSGVWSVVPADSAARAATAGSAAAGGLAPMVLKAPDEPSVVYQRDACREARILDACHRMGAPVPAVVAVDAGSATGRRCFVMERVAGRGLSDSSAAGPHDDEWLRDAGTDVRRAVWASYVDALAALHRIDAAKVPDASHGPRGVLDVLAYWRAALLDVAPAENVPRQLRLLDWLRDRLPRSADGAPAVCMGDARIANCLVAGTEVKALVDFEVAYVGNPAADVAYSVFFDGIQRGNAQRPLDGVLSADEVWDRWGRATGRSTDDRDYWTAFGVTILCVTATRAMVQWGLSDRNVESDNTVVAQWESLVER